MQWFAVAGRREVSVEWFKASRIWCSRSFMRSSCENHHPIRRNTHAEYPVWKGTVPPVLHSRVVRRKSFEGQFGEVGLLSRHSLGFLPDLLRHEYLSERGEGRSDRG